MNWQGWTANRQRGIVVPPAHGLGSQSGAGAAWRLSPAPFFQAESLCRDHLDFVNCALLRSMAIKALSRQSDLCAFSRSLFFHCNTASVSVPDLPPTLHATARSGRQSQVKSVRKRWIWTCFLVGQCRAVSPVRWIRNPLLYPTELRGPNLNHCITCTCVTACRR
jgi:hypothetical protein